jgi:O-antigen/teichoic acid export membrane protein
MFAGKLKQRLTTVDGSLFKGSAILAIGTVVARVLGILFFLVLAQVFLPKDYGFVQYGITLGLLIAMVTQPFSQHVMARFIGTYRHDEILLRKMLSNMWLVLSGLSVLTLLVAVPVLMWLDRFNIGIVVVFVGTTLFYTYWGLSRGFLAPTRLTLAYLGSNLVQLILVVGLIYILDIHEPLLALSIYGLSYLLPLAVLQIVWPLPLYLQGGGVQGEHLREIFQFSWPIWISHISYMLYISMPILVLEPFAGTEAVGVYGVANTLTMAFLFIPTSIATLLMPKTAGLPRHQHLSLLKKTLFWALLVNLIGLGIYTLLVEWFVLTVFGAEYLVDQSTYIILAVAMIVLGSGGVITAVLVGSGRVWVETAGRVVAAVLTAGLCWYLIPSHGAAGAAVAMVVGAVSAVIIYVLMALAGMRADAAATPKTV